MHEVLIDNSIKPPQNPTPEQQEAMRTRAEQRVNEAVHVGTLAVIGSCTD